MGWSGDRLCHNAVDNSRKATSGNEVEGMRTRRIWALAAAPLVVMVLAAGCGGSSSSGGSSGSSLPKGSGQVISIPVSDSRTMIDGWPADGGRNPAGIWFVCGSVYQV
jgi:hypothetical protein